jgi:hypothetical protein
LIHPVCGNVPSYYTKLQTPANCTRQLDFVFATANLASRCSVKALNEPDDWDQATIAASKFRSHELAMRAVTS